MIGLFDLLRPLIRFCLRDDSAGFDFFALRHQSVQPGLNLEEILAQLNDSSDRGLWSLGLPRTAGNLWNLLVELSKRSHASELIEGLGDCLVLGPGFSRPIIVSGSTSG